MHAVPPLPHRLIPSQRLSTPPPLSGYDMDYTLIHYDVEAWEGRAYQVKGGEGGGRVRSP